MNSRQAERQAFAQAQGLPAENWLALPADASPRHYFRIPVTASEHRLLMDVEPDSEDFKSYLSIAKHLRALGFSAPEVVAADVGSGFALIEDFGNCTYAHLLAQDYSESALYELAIDTLAALHKHPQAGQISLPPYDMTALIDEVLLFADWFAPALCNEQALAEFRNTYETLWRQALDDVANVRSALVLRDYHVDNLMLLDKRAGMARCGLLDFQDALIGSASYDVVSLTQDARRDLSPGLEAQLLERYFAARSEINQAHFLQEYYLLAAQRHAKVAGIFMRLSTRDGKPNYLPYIPRVLGLLDVALSKAGLQNISQMLDRSLPGWVNWTPAQSAAARA